MRKEALIDKELLFEQIGYKPHSAEQQMIHDATNRFIIPCCGRRFGKSQSAAHEMTYNLFIPETVWWIVGPTYKLGEKEFRVVHDDFKKLKLLDKCPTVNYNVNQGQMRLVTPFGSVLEVVSAEKQDALVGEGLDGVIMSEAAKHKMSTWQMYIEPALSDRRGSAWFPSTPQGFNWYKGLFDMGQRTEEFPDYKSWRFPTWMNKAMYPGGYDDVELVRIRGSVSKQYWEQEYGAEFTSFEGQIYPEFNERDHVRHIEYVPGWKNFWVFDFGFTDPFVCLDIMVDPSDNVYVWREYQVSHQSTWTHGHILKNRDNPIGFHVDLMYGDPRGADEIATLQLVLGYVYSQPVGWSLGVEAVKRHLKPADNGPAKLFIDPSCQHLIRQMNQLRAKVGKEDHNERPGQHDYDDHGPDALRYFFNHYFVLGHNATLESVYDKRYADTEAASFFTYSSGISLDDRIGFD